ncbi:hypothetical protein [Aminobacter sp. LjRoot7]|jgi:hypothetical protein|uniref:hypothetical protein n=1 Tax=Aminobacter sp. LjRoot7 TaxID=3342335 RepID=UPI003F4FC257
MNMEVSLVAKANERRQAVRTLFERGAVDIELLSAASGYAVSSIERRILREGWVSPVSDDIDDRLARLADSLVGQVETLRLENEGGFDKGQVDMVGSIVRTVEKISELMRGGDRAKVSQTNRDAEMADVLARIDRRIIELARDYARVLGAGEPDRA